MIEESIRQSKLSALAEGLMAAEAKKVAEGIMGAYTQGNSTKESENVKNEQKDEVAGESAYVNGADNSKDDAPVDTSEHLLVYFHGNAEDLFSNVYFLN